MEKQCNNHQSNKKKSRRTLKLIARPVRQDGIIKDHNEVPTELWEKGRYNNKPQCNNVELWKKRAA